MPLWTDAYLADCGHLDDAETGRYLMMLIHLWRAPNQRFPNDDEWLARKFRRSVEDVNSQLRPLILEFCHSTGNWIIQPRLSREFAYVLSKSKKQSARAKSRWTKEKDLSHGNAPTPTPTPQVKMDSKESTKKPPITASSFPCIITPEVAQAYLDFRRAKRQPVTQFVLNRLGQALELLRTEGYDPNEALGTAMDRGWQGFKAEWIRNDAARTKGNGNGKLDRMLNMATRVDGRTQAEGDMDRGEGAGASESLFSARLARPD